MSPEIVILEPIKVLFVRRIGNYMQSAQQAWDVLGKFADQHNLAGENTKAIGIPYDDPRTTPEQQLRYDACLTFEGDFKAEGEIGIQTIEGGRYAVFVHQGQYEGLDKIYNSIFKEWLPASGEKLRELPMFEMYLAGGKTGKDTQKYETAIFVPID